MQKTIKTWLINLPRATERRQKMDAQLAEMPLLDVTVFDGVDGRARGARTAEKCGCSSL